MAIDYHDGDDHGAEQAPEEEEDEEDFYGDQEDGDIDGNDNDQPLTMAQRESASESRRFLTAGYHNTFDVAHDAALQSGFDAGYQMSYGRSTEIGHCLGRQVARAKVRSLLLLLGTTSAGDDGGGGGGEDSSSTQRTGRYLKEMASIIRTRLTALTMTTADEATAMTTTTTPCSSLALEMLAADVRRIAASAGEEDENGCRDSTGTLVVPSP
jgi:hypothetical protein